MRSYSWLNIWDSIKRVLRNRSLYTAILVIVLTVVLLARLYRLQIIEGASYNEQAAKDVITTSELRVDARRGDIYDRNGVLLATTRTAYSVEMVNYAWDQASRDEMYLKLVELFESNNDVFVNNFRRYISPDIEWGTSLAGDDKETSRSNWINQIISGFKKSDKDNINSARDAFEYLRNTVFELDKNYTDEQAYKIMIIRYETHMHGLSYITPTTIATDASKETMEYLTARYYEYPGISTQEVYFRVYTDAMEASHLIGYVRAISETEYEELKDSGYANDDVIGKIGIEKAAETELRGTNGTRVVYRDSDGVVRTLSYTPPVAGADVYLTIDYEFQKQCVNILKETIESIAASADDIKNFGDANAGAAVVTDVRTGEVIAMANYPYYDNSIFIAPSTDTEAQQAITQLFQDPSSPSLNRATQGLYPVGSTIKPLISIATLMEGTNTPSRVINCSHVMTIGNRTHSCLGWHGNTSLASAIARSCNIYFYTAGIELGIEKIDAWAKNFGLGEKTGIEISEYAGYRSNPETMAIRESDTSHIWSNSDTAQTSIGQLYTLFTPLQLCNYTAAIANGGYLNTPYLIGSVVAKDGTVINDGSVAAANRTSLGVHSWVLDAVEEGMLEMVRTSGLARTAFAAFPEGYVAAKTGTPQTGMEAYGESSHSVLICYAPADDPQIALSIVIEHGAAGGNSLEAAGRIFNAYFGVEASG